MDIDRRGRKESSCRKQLGLWEMINVYLACCGSWSVEGSGQLIGVDRVGEEHLVTGDRLTLHMANCLHSSQGLLVFDRW